MNVQVTRYRTTLTDVQQIKKGCWRLSWSKKTDNLTITGHVPYKQHSTNGPKLSVTNEYFRVKQMHNPWETSVRRKSALNHYIRPEVVRISLVYNGHQRKQTGQLHSPELLDMQKFTNGLNLLNVRNARVN